MRILITNNTLADRAGTELYVRDVAFVLKKHGHEAVCFSMQLGEVAQELEAQGIRVVSSLSQAHGPFDVIHGHHCIESTLAAMAFPRVPVISFCHGPKLWQESPCRMPNVVRYVAVDEACRERLVNEGIAEERIVKLLNFADTRRFLPRGPLPEKPRQALIFSNNASASNYLTIVMEACGRFGIRADVAGRDSGHLVQHPEKLLPSYDLVFAKARAAIEAMAVGCAVVQCDYFGAGWLVTSQRFDELRQLNFGYKSMQQPLTVEHLSAQIAAYDAVDAAIVSRRIREEASLDKFGLQLLELYHKAQTMTWPDFDPWAAAGEFLQVQMGHAKNAQNRLPWLEEEYLKTRKKATADIQKKQELKDKCAVLKEENRILKQSLALQRHSRRPWWKKILSP